MVQVLIFKITGFPCINVGLTDLRGVYFTSSSPPPLGVGGGGMIIHQGKENSKYAHFFKKLRKNGDKRKKIKEMGMKTYVFVD